MYVCMQAPFDWRELTIATLDAFLREKYHYSLQSLSLGDNMLFADFLSLQGGSVDSSTSSTIYDLLIQLFREEAPDIDSRDDYSNDTGGVQCSVEESAEKLQSFIEGKQFLLFEITCCHVGDDNKEGGEGGVEGGIYGKGAEVDAKLPPLKVSVSAVTGRDAARAAATEGGTAVSSSRIGGVFTKLRRVAGSFLLR